MRHRERQYNAMQCNTTQHNTMQYNALFALKQLSHIYIEN